MPPKVALLYNKVRSQCRWQDLTWRFYWNVLHKVHTTVPPVIHWLFLPSPIFDWQGVQSSSSLRNSNFSKTKSAILNWYNWRRFSPLILQAVKWRKCLLCFERLPYDTKRTLSWITYEFWLKLPTVLLPKGHCTKWSFPSPSNHCSQFKGKFT